MATIDIPDKICPHCGGIRWYVYVNKGYTHHHCHVKRTNNYKKFAKDNPEKVKVYKRKADRKKSINLTNSYIKERIILGSNLKFKDVDLETVERFRTCIKMIRQLKQIENEENNKKTRRRIAS